MKRILVVALLLTTAMGQEILRPTADADNSGAACSGSVVASTAMTASYDASGTATSSNFTVSGLSGGIQRKKGRVFTTWAGASGPYSALTLNVNSSCSENGATGGGGECIIRYSLDGGTTWTNLISETLFDGSGWVQQTSTVTLTPSQALSQVQIDACGDGVGGLPVGTASVTIWDIWTSGTLIPPAAPTSLVVTAAGTGLSNSLTWTDNATNETSYQINKCTGASCTPTVYQTGLAANSTSYTDSTGVTNSTTYGYQACAVNAAGTACSTTTFVTTPAATPPASPTGLTTSFSNISVILNWTDNANNETGYVVQRCQGAACTPVDLTTIAGNSTSFIDNTANQKATYVYQVVASNPAGRSGGSNQSTVITLGHQPNASSHMISH